MKSFTIDIHPELAGIEVIVKNGRQFSEAAIQGVYKIFSFSTNENDLERIKAFAVKHGNDNSSNLGNWYAHCNGYAMDLIVLNRSEALSLNTYRPYGRPVQK